VAILENSNIARGNRNKYSLAFTVPMQPTVCTIVHQDCFSFSKETQIATNMAGASHTNAEYMINLRQDWFATLPAKGCEKT
jgi:hypothetical protein